MSLYVYAISGSAASSFDAAGYRVEFIDLGGVFAVAATMDERPALTEGNLRNQHDIVSAIAARVDAVVPARFGSLVDRAELRRVVALRRDAILEALALVAGREQMTIRVIGAGESTARERVESMPMSGTRYLQQRKTAAEWTLPPGARAVVDAVRALVHAERVVGGEGRVLATVYHLVTRGASVDYARRLDACRATHAGFPFIISGPWPPFAFAPELWS